MESYWGQARFARWDGIAHATHTMDVSLIDGIPHVFCLVEYAEPRIDNSISDVILAINLVDGTVKPTVD
eukprot:12413133-Karenia_brevis.AAC.1